MWIIGAMGHCERKILEKRGWEIEPAERLDFKASEDGEMHAVFVDNDAFRVMDGDEWEWASFPSPLDEHLHAHWRMLVSQNECDLDWEEYRERVQNVLKAGGA